MSQPAAANDDQPTGAFAELWQILRDLGRELIEVTEAQIDQTLALNHAAGRIRKVVLRGLTGLLYLFLCWLLAQPRWSWEELARRVGSVATNRALEDGIRTSDLARGDQATSTDEMGDIIARYVAEGV